MSRYVFGRFVEQDLRAIRDYIATDSPDAAVRQIRRFLEAFRKLSANPKIGHTREDLFSGVRFWPVGTYFIVYRADRTPIEIVAVVHGGRDVPSILNTRA